MIALELRVPQLPDAREDCGDESDDHQKLPGMKRRIPEKNCENASARGARVQNQNRLHGREASVEQAVMNMAAIGGKNRAMSG